MPICQAFLGVRLRLASGEWVWGCILVQPPRSIADWEIVHLVFAVRFHFLSVPALSSRISSKDSKDMELELANRHINVFRTRPSKTLHIDNFSLWAGGDYVNWLVTGHRFAIAKSVSTSLDTPFKEHNVDTYLENVLFGFLLKNWHISIFSIS